MKKQIIKMLIITLSVLTAASPISLCAQDNKDEAVATIEFSGSTLAYNTYCLIGSMND